MNRVGDLQKAATTNTSRLPIPGAKILHIYSCQAFEKIKRSMHWLGLAAGRDHIDMHM